MTSRKLALLLSTAFLAALLASCGSSSSSSQNHNLADGTYVFHLAGQAYYSSTQPSSPYFVVGAFTVSRGVITQGEEDFADFYGVYPAAQIQPSQSSLGVTQDGNLQIKLSTGFTGTVVLGIAGVQTINVNMASSTSGRIAEFDASAAGTGSLDLQSSTAQPTGGYAFFTAGLDNQELPLALGGVINIDNLAGPGTISGTGSVFDLNDSPSLGLFSAQTLSTSLPSTVSAPDSFGRVVFTLTPSSSTIGNIQLVGYIIDSSTIQLVEIHDGLLGTTGGAALSQGSTTGNFSAANLSGSTYLAGSQGQEKIGVNSSNIYQVGSGYLQFAAPLTFNSDSSVSGQASFNDIATQLANGAINAGATYSVDPTGRVTVSGLTTTDPNTPSALQLYIDGNGNAFVISMDTSDVTAGVAFQQTAGASISGSYSITASGATPVLNTTTDLTTYYFWAGAGQASASSGSTTGFTDLNVLPNPQVSGSQNADVDLAGTSTMTATDDILTGTIAGLGYASATNQYVYYVIDSTRAFAIETDANQLSEVFAQSSSKQ